MLFLLLWFYAVNIYINMFLGKFFSFIFTYKLVCLKRMKENYIKNNPLDFSFTFNILG